MKLYDFPFSPNCRKVRAVAYEVGTQLEYIHIDLLKNDAKAPAFLAKNPNGRVPVLEDGDFFLWESTAIMRYLAAGTPLLPTARRVSADVDRWLAWQLAHLAPAVTKVGFERVVKPRRGLGSPDASLIAAGTADFDAATAVLEGELGNREYVAGPLTIADFSLAGHYTLAEPCGLELARYPTVRSWLSRVVARDSMQRALADAKLP